MPHSIKARLPCRSPGAPMRYGLLARRGQELSVAIAPPATYAGRMRSLLLAAAALAAACSSTDDGRGGGPGAPADAGTGGGSSDGSGDDGPGGGADAGNVACASAAQFPRAWIRGGPDCPDEEAIQVHRYDQDTFILRQSLCTSFEAPFLYLLFGQDRVLLEDTGAGGIEIADAVLAIIDQVLGERGQDSIELLVVNS